jgi:hypothetical protein
VPTDYICEAHHSSSDTTTRVRSRLSRLCSVVFPTQALQSIHKILDDDDVQEQLLLCEQMDRTRRTGNETSVTLEVLHWKNVVTH